MSEFVTTSLGDSVALDRRGSGPSVVFVAGAGPWREIDPETTRTAQLLADAGFTTIVYDRVGRGESAATAPIPLERELAAIAAVCAAVDGDPVLCGHSSGCALALRAASAGLAVAGLVLWEAPLDPPGTAAQDLADALRRLIADGRLREALALYMRDMPPEILEIVASIPAMVEQAASLQPDADALAWASSAPLPALLEGLDVPLLALLGTESYDDVMVPAAEAIAAAVPGARWTRVTGANHQWEPAAMAAAIARFATERDAIGVRQPD